MKKLRKAGAYLLMLALLVSSFTGCSKSGKSTDQSSKDNVGTSSEAKTDETTQAKTEPKSDDVVTIEYMSHKSESEAIDALDKMIALFEEKNPDIKVTHTTTSDFLTVLQTRAQTGEMPDVFSFSSKTVYEEMFRDGMIMDLTGQEFLQNVQESALNLSALDGKNWRLPYTLSGYGIYIRKDIFEELGIKIPTTYEEVLDAAEQLKKAGITPFASEDKDLGAIGQRAERIMGIINADCNEEFKQLANDEITVNDSKVLTTYAKVQVDIANNTGEDSLGVDHTTAIQNFVNGQNAMYISGTWSLATMKTYAPDIQVEFINFPNPTGQDTKIPVNIDTSFAISSSTKHQEACLRFLEFLSTAEAAQIFCDGEGTPNVVKGVNYGVTEFVPIIEAINNNNIFVTLSTVWPSGLRDELGEIEQRLIIEKDQDAFLKEAAEIIHNAYNN